MAAAYATRALALGWQEQAARALEQALEARWSPQLLPLLAHTGLSGQEPEQAQRLQHWLHAHPTDAALQLAAAHHALRRQQWPQARQLLLQAVDNGGGIAAWEALGEGHADNGEDHAASACLRNALRLRRGEPALPLERLADASRDNLPEQRDDHGLPHLGPPAG